MPPVQLTGFPAKPYSFGLPGVSHAGAAAARTFIDLTTFGVAVGDFTSGGGLAAAFDGVAHDWATGARKSPSTSGMGNWIGRDFSAPVIITSFEAQAPTNDYFRGDNGTGALTLWASDTTRPGGVCVWAGTYPSGMAAQVSVQDFQAAPSPLSGRFWWLEVEGNGANAVNLTRFKLRGYYA